jgi:hypothetical protein
MMKKIMIGGLLLMAVIGMQAQDIQLHYDLGRNIYPNEEMGRPKVTMTLEQFRIDMLGSWFYFVDVDFSRKFTESAYTEISREFNLPRPRFAVHVEYDGGLSRSGSFQQAGLAGIAYNGWIPSVSMTYSLQLMYKRYFKSYDNTSAYHSMQLTGVWYLPFGKCSFKGFADVWRGEKYNHHGQLVFLAEPQLWYDVTDHLKIGTECEISSHFIYNTYNNKSFFVNPTIGLMWDF